jgi:SprT protein
MDAVTKIPETYLPTGAFPLVTSLLEPYDLDIKIVKSRSTKYADFNPPVKNGKIPFITINNNLNQYSFLITLLHELAHYYVWRDGKVYAKPHGRSWKNHFRQLMQNAIDQNIFPETILPQLEKHILNPRATSCSDTRLFRELSVYDTVKTGTFIDDIPDGQLFQIADGQIFKKEKKVRKRIMCENIKNRKKYLFSPIYKVIPIKGQQYVMAFP